MQAVSFLTDWITYLLIIIPSGAALIVAYESLMKSTSGNFADVQDANKKIKNTIKAAIIAECISGFITIVKSFYM